MRRWTVTVGLTVTAVTAAIVAPRLMPQRDVQLPVHVVEPPETPVVAVPPEPVRALPARPNAIRLDGGAAGAVTFDTIPEAQDPPAVEDTPPPLPDDFWMDAVDCGMG